MALVGRTCLRAPMGADSRTTASNSRSSSMCSERLQRCAVERRERLPPDRTTLTPCRATNGSNHQPRAGAPHPCSLWDPHNLLVGLFAQELLEDGGKYHIAAGEAPFSAQLVRSWAAMAARGDPNGPGGVTVWPVLTSSTNGSALLIEGGAGTPGAFRAAPNFMHEKCALFDAVFDGRRGPPRVVGPLERMHP